MGSHFRWQAQQNQAFFPHAQLRACFVNTRGYAVSICCDENVSTQVMKNLLIVANKQDICSRNINIDAIWVWAENTVNSGVLLHLLHQTIDFFGEPPVPTVKWLLFELEGNTSASTTPKDNQVSFPVDWWAIEVPPFGCCFYRCCTEHHITAKQLLWVSRYSLRTKVSHSRIWAAGGVG